MFFSSSFDFSWSSKYLAFHSLHMVHIKHNEAILHTTITERVPTWPLQQTNRSITLSGITHVTSKRVKSPLHKSHATSQWRRKWSIDSLLLLHIHYHPTTINPLFRRLSKVRILPRTTVQKKKLTLRCTLTFQILLQGKEETPEIDNSWKNDCTSNFFLFKGIHRIQSPPPCLHLRKYIPKKASTSSTSQSCTAHKKGTFHWITPLETCILSMTLVSLHLAIRTIPERRPS
jgi:hypothetical protein